MGNLSQTYGAPPAIWDHTVLPATRVGMPCLNFSQDLQTLEG